MKPLRKDLTPGTNVMIIQKNDQRSGVLTEGIVANILTKSPSHPHGIKVRLETGEVGRVQKLA
ncbi:YwbE family protein [Gillisia sp. Q332]|uniref:YwbE family protein n=1 Tax=Gillisia xinjiangensis TaxID=3384765 RepID=UPI00391CC049